MLSLHSRCPVCEERNTGKQLYAISGATGVVLFDVAKAQEIAHDGRAPVLVPFELLNRMLLVNREWSPAHAEHVNTSQPGIIGVRLGAYLLLDGTHRAAQILTRGGEFTAYVLTQAECDACEIASAPAELKPQDIAQELRGILHRNPHAQRIEAEVAGDAGSERAIRRFLSESENRRVVLRRALGTIAAAWAGHFIHALFKAVTHIPVGRL